jgi:hypothetical protein
MKPNSLQQGVLTERCSWVAPVTRKMVRERAVELAVSSGHSAEDATKSDWEQAKRELMGERNASPNRFSEPEDFSKNVEVKLKDHPFLKGMKPEHIAVLARHAR